MIDNAIVTCKWNSNTLTQLDNIINNIPNGKYSSENIRKFNEITHRELAKAMEEQRKQPPLSYEEKRT